MKTANDYAAQAMRCALRAIRRTPVKQAECWDAVAEGAAECRADRRHGWQVDDVAVARKTATCAARLARYARFGNRRGLSPIGAREAVLRAFFEAGYAGAIA